MGFPLFVARRYLLASRKQAIIFIISLISVLGVIVGVAALVVVLALMTGFQEQIQARILGSNAHLTILSGWAGRPLADGDDPAIPMAQAAWRQAHDGPWGKVLTEALERTAQIARALAGIAPEDSLWRPPAT